MRLELPTDENPVVVIEGDCLEVLPWLPKGCVGATITDPPYSARTHAGHDSSAHGHRGQGRDNAERKALGYAAWGEAEFARFIPAIHRVSTGWLAIMTDHTLAPVVSRHLAATGRYVFAPLPFYAPGSRVRLSGDGPSSWTDWIIVARTHKQSKWGTLPGGYVANGVGWRDKEHMGGKPTMLMRSIIRDYSKEGNIILDPCCGSGTTGVAAILEGRKAILIEKDPAYAAIARRRIAQTLGDGPGTLIGSAKATSLFNEGVDE